MFASALIVAVALIPIFFVIGYTIEIGWHDAYALLVRPRVGELLWNTVRLVVATILLCALIGTTAAWLVERTTLPARRVWSALFAAPLAVPAFVNSFSWVSLTPRVEGFAGATLIVTLSYFPFVFLPVAASLRGLDPALEETAHGLGMGSTKTFFRVVLPQLRPALIGGSLLVGLHLLAEFGALQMLRFPTFTTAIFDQYNTPAGSPAANMLAAVLLIGCVILLTGEMRIAGSRRYARIGSGSRRDVERRQLGKLMIPVFAACFGLVVLALGVPLASLLHWLREGTSTAFPVDSLIETTGTTIGLGAGGALLTVAAALPLAWLTVRYPGFVSTVLERGAYFGNAMPGIVVALALVTVSVNFVHPVYQTVLLLLVAYAIMFLPRALVSTRAALAQAPPVFDDVARSLGASPFSTFRRVTLPLIAPGIGAGAALVFLAVVNELTATLLLAPIGTQTLATQFWSNSSSVAYGAAAPYAVVMILISCPATFLLTRSVRKSVQS